MVWRCGCRKRDSSPPPAAAFLPPFFDMAAGGGCGGGGAAREVERLPELHGELAQLGVAAERVAAVLLHEGQQRLDVPAQALGGGAAQEGVLHRPQQLMHGVPGQLLEQDFSMVDLRRGERKREDRGRPR